MTFACATLPHPIPSNTVLDAPWLLTRLNARYPDADLLLLHYSALTQVLTAIGSHIDAFTLAPPHRPGSTPFSWLLPTGHARCHASLLRSGLMQQAWLSPWWHRLDPLLSVAVMALDEAHLLLMAGRPRSLRLWQQDARLSTLIQECRQPRRATAQCKHQGSNASLLQQRLTGSADATERLRHELDLASQHGLTVLLHGETGTGKEIAARLLHDCSPRQHGPFIAINCAAIPENLIESELFGYHKGAFSGAQREHTGLLQQADGGTLFLDEIGDMPTGMQIKLLRALETRQLRPLGARSETRFDVRVVAASHRSLPDMVSAGLFRADLYHRLGQCQIQLPALRERRIDLPELCQHFSREHSPHGHERPLHPSLQQALGHYSFPGNIRELRNLIAIACAVTPDAAPLSLECLPEHWRHKLQGNAHATDPHADIRDLRLALQRYEAEIIRARLLSFAGNRLHAAASLGLPRRTLDNKCLKLGIR